MVDGRGLKCTSQIRGQPRINTFHHPEKLFSDGDDEEDDNPDAAYRDAHRSRTMSLHGAAEQMSSWPLSGFSNGGCT